MMTDTEKINCNRRRRIGVFGGSFDPPHLGHFICARIVGEKLGLEKILVIPTAIQPHKPGGPIAMDEERWKMVKAITADDTLFEPSRIEIERSGVSYSVETLEMLTQIYAPEKWEYFLIIGSDTYADINRWHNPDRIFELTSLAVMCRPGFTLPAVTSACREKTVQVETPFIDFSSTWIKNRITEGLPIRWLVGNAVDRIIQRLGLYR